MNEKAIQNAIWRDYGPQSGLLCPNYTPLDWWECDVFRVTKNGYGVEFEIKISLKDFKADVTKKKQFQIDHGLLSVPRFEWELKGKHDMLASRDSRGPSRFYYVMPERLGVKAEDVPEWAGLMVVDQINHFTRLATEKEAPRLHGERVKEEVLDHCRGVFMWRYWRLRTRLRTDDPRLTTEPKTEEAADAA